MVSDSDGWRPLQIPKRAAPADSGEPADGSALNPLGDEPGPESETAADDGPEPGAGGPRAAVADNPFVRLARVHAASAAADAMVYVALAGSLFFSIDPDAARWRILLYLLFTMAPFAVVGPFIGPTLDKIRGGRRTVIMIISTLRVVAALLMIPNLDSVLLFPIAFAYLVLGKSYAVAKASIVPATVRSDAELVERNSRLAILSGVAGFVGAAPAVLMQWLVGPEWTVALAALTYLGALYFARLLPVVEPVADESIDEDLEAVELRGRTILLSSTAMSVLRAIVGFMFWMVAFAFRGGTDDIDLSPLGKSTGAAIRTALGYPVVDQGVTAVWKLGVIGGFSVLGGLIGNLAAPRVRERFEEEDMLLGAITAVLTSAILATWVGGLNGAGLMALVIGLAAAIAKVAFDTIVQRDAPDANYGSSFAQFETRFQIAWVLGALLPVIRPIPPRLGFFLIAVAALFAGASYYVGSRVDGPGRDMAERLTALRGRRPAKKAAEEDSAAAGAEPAAGQESPGWVEPVEGSSTRSIFDREQPEVDPNQPTLWDDHR